MTLCTVRLNVNRDTVELRTEARRTLLDGMPMYACLMLAVDCQERAITTIEGLATGHGLDPVQRAFIEADAFQCGLCTPGQIMSIKGLLASTPEPSEDDVRRAVSGNLCRCGAYQHIVRAGLLAAEWTRNNGSPATA